MVDPISLYLHVPFCTKKCPYCHFFVLPDREELQRHYLRAVLQEIHWRAPLFAGREIASLYFGGGTPSLLPASVLKTLLAAFSDYVVLETAEITLEANPETFTLEKAYCFADLGINRLSFGVQSFSDTLLSTLGRTHSAQEAENAVHAAVSAGINNLSIDLIYDLPSQSLSNWQESLERAVSLPISHLSLYNLTIEPHTLFFRDRERITQMQPKEEESASMYLMATKILPEAGLEQYEISAFARNGARSRHNSGYWTARPFLGFGPSAFSEWEGKRFRNIAHLQRYCQALTRQEDPVDFREELEPLAKSRERLILALRLCEGTSLHDPDPSLQLSLNKLVDLGLLTIQGNQVRLTQRGVLFYDEVAAELVLT